MYKFIYCRMLVTVKYWKQPIHKRVVKQTVVYPGYEF